MRKIINYFHHRFFWIATVLLTVLLHFYFLALPPKSMHLWRQCHTLAVARNFFEESMNITEPRVDNRMGTSGITGSQFPAFEYGLALLYYITGEQFAVQRIYCLLLHIFGIIGTGVLVYQLTKNRLMANISSWSYAWSPLLFYYAITALPDNMALPASIWGLYFFLKWFENRERTTWIYYMLASFVFLCIAGLTKIQYLAIGFFILSFTWTQKNSISFKQWTGFFFFGSGISILTISWYVYARNLIAKSGLTDFGLEFKPDNNISRGARTLFSNITSSLPELLLNYASFALLLYSAFYLSNNSSLNKPLRNGLLTWSGIFVVYHLIELRQMENHDYYMMPYLAVLPVLTAFGACKGLQTKYITLIILLVLIQPLLACMRIVPSRFLAEETEDKQVLYDKKALETLKSCVPDTSLCIVGPDNSRCIYFYFLHKKGFGFGDEGLTDSLIKDYISKGARYVYTSNNLQISSGPLKQYVSDPFCSVKNFYVYPLKANKND